MRTGCESHHDHPRVRIAESGHRPCPVIPGEVSATLLAPDLLAIEHQPRTLHALDYLVVEDCQRSRRHVDILSGRTDGRPAAGILGPDAPSLEGCEPS